MTSLQDSKTSTSTPTKEDSTITDNVALEEDQLRVRVSSVKPEDEEVKEEGEGEGEDREMKDESSSMMMDDDDDNKVITPAIVFRIVLKQPRSNLVHKMRVPELCRNFSAVSWCGKMNVVACATETCARIPSSNAHPPFWIPIHIVNPERPTESAVFNVKADSPRDSVQFIEWSPANCPRALLVANFHGRITIWTQPSKGPSNLIRDSSCWQCEHEWRQDIAVVTKWLSGISHVCPLFLCSNLHCGGSYTMRIVYQHVNVALRL
ncbi:hypothetical protein GIB67_021270 [Kingdonia uniflora]|uniref:Mediator of RNA polymerase II transcription subunit 16 n=1 Tax=Kingdonia uniflora TaxID=39325 RepID=A0A7J7LG18_9MAGN|nr:hypothetical protein GIB67_021270 [Kingdonia uniflora]